MSEKMADGTLTFEHVSKRYRLGTLGTLRGAVSAVLSRRGDADDSRRILWALRDVSFRVGPGECLGLIGPNGAGKTTTLKLLSNITRPTSGRIAVHGRVSSLIELGAGFHPELTGRENVYLNGAILGLRRREIDRKLDAIISFSELERYMDTPVKRYSSGMYVRLGFAVAVHVEPDILLVDEVLAVGDAAFRQKCVEHMRALRKSGTTIIFVSHNMHQVRWLCAQALLLIEGQPRFLGEAGQAISTYEKAVQSWMQKASESPRMAIPDATGSVRVATVTVLDAEGQQVQRLQYDQGLKVRATYQTVRRLHNPIVKVRLIRADGTVCAMAGSHYEPDLAWTLDGQGAIAVYFEPIQLVAGAYVADLRIIDAADSVLLASGQSEPFYVDSPGFLHETDRGVFVPRVRWSHNSMGYSPPPTKSGKDS